MKSIKYILLITIAVMSGCKEEWLDNEPLGRDTEISFYSNFAAADQTCNAAYGNLCKDQAFDVDYFVAFGCTPGDDIEAGGENIYDASQFSLCDMFEFSPSINYVNRFWNYNYAGIKLCNYSISKLELVREKDKANSGMIDLRIAEMKYLRAFYHFLIGQVYGGGPYITEVISPDQFKTLTRTPLGDFYSKLEKDLTEAIEVLPTRSQLGAANIARASKGAAQALLGKALLYESSYAANYVGDSRFVGTENRFADALVQLEAVINSNEYELVGLDSSKVYKSWWNSTKSADTSTWGRVGAFRWIFTTDADNCKENVWEIQRQRDQLGWITTRGSYLPTYTTARWLGDGSFDRGWSFNSPSPYLEKAFGNNDEREDGLLSNTEKYLSSLDPRYPVSIGKNGDSLLYEGGSRKWVKLNFTGKNNNLPTGMIGRKFECSPAEFWNAPKNNIFQEGPYNTRHIRMGDVYLMAAEAALLSGDAAKALKYINDVRTRARLSGVVGGYPKYTGYPKNLSAVKLEDIMHERRLELAGEPFRFFDVVRWNRTEFLNVDLVERKITAQFVKGKNEFFPIPLVDVQTSEGAIKQNPNY